MVTERLLVASLGVGFALFAGCLEPASPFVSGPVVAAGLPLVPMESRLDLKATVPEGGWSLWLWNASASGHGSDDWIGFKSEVGFVAAAETPGQFWAGAYWFYMGDDGNWRLSRINSEGALRYATKAALDQGPAWGVITSYPALALTTAGLLVFSERPGTFSGYVEVGSQSGKSLPLQPLALGTGARVLTPPISDPAETIRLTPTTTSASLPDFAGGFAAPWGLADLPPPYAYSVSGTYRMTYSDGQRIEKPLIGALPLERDTRTCISEDGTPGGNPRTDPPTVCRSSSFLVNWDLGLAGRMCLPPGDLRGEASYSQTGAVRFLPVLVSVPVTIC